MVNNSLKKHVCIVGAGIPGLRCADILLSHGFDVTILEARDKIGGRVYLSLVLLMAGAKDEVLLTLGFRFVNPMT